MYATRVTSKALYSPANLLKVNYASQARNRLSQPYFPRKTTKRLPPSSSSKRRSNLPRPLPSSQPPSEPKQSSVDAVSTALRDASSENNNLLSPVFIPEDSNSVLNERHPAASILGHSSIVVTRQLELMNVMLGFEQANKYVIMDPQGNHIGYMAERDLGMGSMMKRQFFNTHRSFSTHVFDMHGKEVLRFHRPFSWISSRIGVYDPLDYDNDNTNNTIPPQSTSQSLAAATTAAPGAMSTEVNPASAQASQLPLTEMHIIGEAQQRWAPLRRKYNLFLHQGSTAADASFPPSSTPQLSSGTLPLSTIKNLEPIAASTSSFSSSSATTGSYAQFAYIDERFLSWDFSLLSSDNRLLGSVSRNFSGFGREIFTDTGVYALRMDAASYGEQQQQQQPDLTNGSDSSSSSSISNPAQAPTHEKGIQVVSEENQPGMTLDQRAVMLATAVSVDFDYFSRHSGPGGGVMGGGGFLPLWFPGMGGGGAVGAEAGAAGAGAGAIEGVGAEAGAGGQLGRTMGGAGGAATATGEGAMVGAAGAGGYEAMQRGGAFDQVGDSSTAAGGGDGGVEDPFGNGSPPSIGQQQEQQSGQGEEDIWGTQDDPWGGDKGGGNGGSGGTGGDGGGGDGEGGFDITDWF